MVDKDEKLTLEQYNICRLKGTEAPFSGQYWDHHEEGVYHCVCCGNALFASQDKFDSKSGWPSYMCPINESVIQKQEDHSHGMKRIEVTCKNCHAHLGHVFPDGPAPTYLRYCINSAALRFEKAK